MDTHKNASITPRGREAMARSVVEGGLSRAAAAHQFHTTPKTVAKWVGGSTPRDRPSRECQEFRARAIIAPMEGEYGDQEGHVGRSSGGPRSEGGVFEGRAFR